jgi:hypothetical protein
VAGALEISVLQGALGLRGAVVIGAPIAR